MEDEIINSAIDIITPVMESAMILAGEYMKMCNRETLTSFDIQYAMKYCARNVVGREIGTLFPDLEEESDEESESDLEIVDEEDEPFVRYSGDNQLMNDINQAVDTWSEWVPVVPMERMLKDSIDNSY
jgi:hypothetical protein